MTDRELMQQAFDAMSYGNAAERAAARLALRERLEQPEQDVPATCFGNIEPVGWLESPDGAFRENPLYKIKFPSKLLSWQASLYTAAPQRKPLTEEQAFDLFGVCYNISVIRAIEAAHGIKENT